MNPDDETIAMQIDAAFRDIIVREMKGAVEMVPIRVENELYSRYESDYKFALAMLRKDGYRITQNDQPREIVFEVRENNVYDFKTGKRL